MSFCYFKRTYNKTQKAGAKEAKKHKTIQGRWEVFGNEKGMVQTLLPKKNKNRNFKNKKTKKYKNAFILLLLRQNLLTFIVIHLSGKMRSTVLKTTLNRKYCIWMVSGVMISGYIRARIYAHEYVNHIILVFSYNMDTIYVNRG